MFSFCWANQHQHALNDTTKEFTDILAQEEGETDEEEEDQGLAEAMGDLDLMDDDFFGEAKALKGWEKRNVERAMQVRQGARRGGRRKGSPRLSEASRHQALSEP
jgi:hypothetical protein